MKGFKKDGKFHPTQNRNKKALKITDIQKHSNKVDDDTTYEERAEWAWLRRKN